MRYSSLPVGGPPVSVLGFGCSALLGRTDRKESSAALARAWDAGITFYDTARSYGYGESESLLGEFFHGKRDQAVLCTKFGILPAAKGGWKQKVKPLAQFAVKMFPSLRAAARRQAAGLSQSGQFSLDTLHTSFETSLRELKTDYVDILLLHAAPISVLQQDDLLEALGRLVTAGKVRMAGISAEHAVIARAFATRPQPLTTAQFAVNLSSMAFTRLTAAQHGLFLVANHPFGGPTGVAEGKRRIAAMQSLPTLPESLRAKRNRDDALMPEIILNAILSNTGIDAVIPAMMQPHHLQANLRAIDHCRFSPNELALLRAELSATPQSAGPPAAAPAPSA